MFDDVYEKAPWHLSEQRAELLRGPRAPTPARLTRKPRAMPQVNMVQAINDALRIALKDQRVVVLGEDVGKVGGVFRVTAGLQEEFGRNA
jgi:hypothetical protein